MTESRRVASREPAVARPIRVLWLIKGLGPGGAERLLSLSARRRDRDALSCGVAYLLPHKVALVGEIEAEGVATICLGSRRWWDPRWMLRLRRLIGQGSTDVVHAHSPLVAVGARLTLRTLRLRRRPRMVTTDHNVWQSHVRMIRWADALTCSLDDAHLAVSSAVQESMPARLRGRAEVVLHGVDIDAVRAQAGERHEVRRSLGLGERDVVIGTVANLRANKDYPNLLAAARLVVDQDPAVRFVAVGQGPLEDELRAQHRRLGLGDRFFLLGYREDAVRVMSACDVFCLASRHEGLPVALMEALVLGLPVVATDVGGVREVVSHGGEAVLVPPARPDLLAAALVALAGDPDRRAAMAAKALERGRAWSAERAVRRTEDVYREVLRS